MKTLKCSGTNPPVLLTYKEILRNAGVYIPRVPNSSDARLLVLTSAATAALYYNTVDGRLEHADGWNDRMFEKVENAQVYLEIRECGP